MKLYKITDEKDQTCDECQWGEGITHEADGKGEICTEHWIHVYSDPVLGILMNGMLGNYDLDTAHMWEGEGEMGIDNNTEVGCTKYTTIKRLEMPKITLNQRIRFAILCALEICDEKICVKWANDWLDRKDRTEKSAVAIANMVRMEIATWAHAIRAATHAAIGPSDPTIKISRHIACWSAFAAINAGAAKSTSVFVTLDLNRKKIDLIALAHKAVKEET